MGSVEPLKGLHRRWMDRVHFVDVIIRQAHPGPSVEPYRTFDDKLADARRYQQEVAAQVVADDLAGTVHQTYGALADPMYLIDADGRVAFYQMWTHAPTLHTALEALTSQGGYGVVRGGYDRVPHALASMTDGWRGLRRGWPQSFIDLETAAPGMASGSWLGYQFRPLLAPLTLRSTPLPAVAKVGLAVGAAALLALGVRALSSRR
jgi:hypothetical protein